MTPLPPNQVPVSRHKNPFASFSSALDQRVTEPQATIKPRSSAKKPVSTMSYADLVAHWKRFDRQRGIAVGPLLAMVGVSAIGIAGGAWASGHGYKSLWVAGLGLVGAALVIGGLFVRRAESQSFEAALRDFEDYLARWEDDEPNPDYVQLLAVIQARKNRRSLIKGRA